TQTLHRALTTWGATATITQLFHTWWSRHHTSQTQPHGYTRPIQQPASGANVPAQDVPSPNATQEAPGDSMTADAPHVGTEPEQSHPQVLAGHPETIDTEADRGRFLPDQTAGLVPQSDPVLDDFTVPGVMAYLDAPRVVAGVGSEANSAEAPGALDPVAQISPAGQAVAGEEVLAPEGRSSNVPSEYPAAASRSGSQAVAEFAGGSLDVLLAGFGESVRPAVRVWGEPVTGQVKALENILKFPGARSLVFGPQGPMWAINMAGAIKWFTLDVQPIPVPQLTDGPVASIDIDHHGQLTGPTAQALQHSGAVALSSAKTGFCDVNLGADWQKTLGWQPPSAKPQGGR
ncbi:hypothetical protein, partial [Streptomyces sp. NPDC002547]